MEGHGFTKYGADDAADQSESILVDQLDCALIGVAIAQIAEFTPPSRRAHFFQVVRDEDAGMASFLTVIRELWRRPFDLRTAEMVATARGTDHRSVFREYPFAE